VTPVKCVVWDCDGTVWPGVAIESAGDLPEPYPQALRAMATLERRGIVNSVASRTAPAMAERVRVHPDLAGRFVAAQFGWGHKSEAIGRIAAELGIDPGAVAFVDDNPFERAEVAAVLPGVLVLSPEELYARLDSPAFHPPTVTRDARQRGERYRQEAHRRASAESYPGGREEFLRSCAITLAVGTARPDQVDRLAELAERTHRFNTTGEPWPAEQIAAVLADPDWSAGAALLRDRFGDYGLIGAVLLRRDRPPAGWRLRLLAVSCRAAGRDVPLALLAWALRRAAAGGAGRLVVDLRPSDANLELRVLLRRAGFAPDGPAATDRDGLLALARDTAGTLPVAPWLHLVEEA
jgi:FkbH-like protein